MRGFQKSVEIVYSRMSFKYRGSRFSLVELPKLKGALSLLVDRAGNL